MNKYIRIIIEFVIFAVCVCLDRLTKLWAVNTLKDKPSIPIIENVVEFYYLPNGNTGAAFGMLKGHQSLFFVIALVVVLLIGYLLFNMPSDNKYNLINLLLVLIAAGGVGNMIDRFIQNYVVDFIYISCINFPIFNVADMYVSVSTVILAIYLIFILKEEDYVKIETSLKAPFKRKSKS